MGQAAGNMFVFEVIAECTFVLIDIAAHFIIERFFEVFQLFNDVFDVVSALSLQPEIAGKLLPVKANVIRDEIFCVAF